MSVRSAPKSAPKASSRLDHVLKVGMHSAATSSCGGKYALYGNAKSDWGIMHFDKYERYLEEWKEWKRDGWTNESEPLLRSGERPAPRTFKPSSEAVYQVLDDMFGKERDDE
jgi:hypothetical protein